MCTLSLCACYHAVPKYSLTVEARATVAVNSCYMYDCDYDYLCMTKRLDSVIL